MANRVTTLKLGAFFSVGGARVTTLKTAVWADDVTHGVRATTLRFGVYADDHTHGVRATTLSVGGWASLDQGLYLQSTDNAPFGSNEVFTPSITSTFEPVIPPAPQIEVNPFRADVPNVDQQRILREQHNLAQAGDSTFHWGVLTEVSATPLYNLGSIGRFYHDEFGISIARYCKFTSFEKTIAKATPVGLNTRLNQHWVVTNRIDLSDPELAMGIACPYNELVYSGSWYGWVIVDGFVPAEMDVTLDSSEFEWGTEYGWSETGKVKPGVAAPSLGTRFTTTNVPNLRPGEFLVKVSDLSLAKLMGIITTQLEPVSNQLSDLVTTVNDLSGTVDTHTQQIGQLQSQVVGLDNRITSESAATAKQLAAIRALMPDGDFKTYVDTQVNQHRLYVDAQDSIIGQIANNALAKVNDLELKFEAQSTTQLQNQIDALNGAMGDLTNRLVGFTTEIDTNVLTAGQVLVTVDAGLTPGGAQLYTFQPVDYSFANLVDVDMTTTPPTNGQVPVWDNTLSQWLPGDMTGGGGGGGSSWEKIGSYEISSAVADFDFKDFGDDYTDFLLICRNIATSASTQLTARVSTDNGVSYYAASGDYKTLTAGTGVENNSGGLSITFTASTAARSGVTRISGNLGDGNPPVAESITPYENAGSAAQLRYFVASTDPINAIQFYVAAGNMTSGTAYLLGMKKSSGGGNSIGVQLSRSSNQSLPHASTDKIEWNVEDKNDDGMFDSGTSNTDINILEDGWYSMSMYCYVGDSATNGRNYYVYLNGVITSQNTEIINTGTGSQLNNTLTCIRWLTAGDVIDFRVRQNSGSTLSIGNAICSVVKI